MLGEGGGQEPRKYVAPGAHYDVGEAGLASIELQIHDACGMVHTPSKSHLELHVHIAGPYGGPAWREKGGEEKAREREREREREYIDTV